MTDPFVAEIRIFPFSFAPTGWARCDGQLLPIQQNTALFALLGTTYGGDGRSTFALPDLQGSAPMHPGQGPGLSPHDLGEVGGSESVTLLASEIPVHAHVLQAAALAADQPSPEGTLTATVASDSLYAPAAALAPMAPQALAPAGGGRPHNNMMPYLTTYFCIALQGVYPPRP